MWSGVSAADDNFCNQGGENRSTLLDLQRVHCSPHIHHTNVSGVLYGYHGTLADVDRRLLQETMTLVTSESRWVWESAQITVNGKNVKVVFYSGARTNKYVVHLTGDDSPIQRVEEKGWRLWFRDGVVTIWSTVKEVAAKVAGAIVGEVGMKALGGMLTIL
ncbi:Hypp3489 [Branchiostoma lanceolatum]|uniref:Hypp3489 protein n=1 Tax=Branchiostoma lanceolatum TaxID=7740 RepID=A0A8K0A0R8_BRALA|nr:Hypp3489 [Branchiostoma lanceolatum]